ncbi:MAG: phosphatase PAP2 family protein [Tissierellia bacterium]|nr:phosphatase PAP2 family protein [Tissierellia bacterium]
MKNPLKALDDFLIKLINQKLRHPLLNIFYYYFTHVGGMVFTSILSLGLVIFARGHLAKTSYQMLMALALNMMVVFFTKRIVGRNRPYWIEKNLHTYGIDLKDYSFPSGHTTSAFTMALIFSFNYPGYGIIFIGLALLVAISRIYLAVHYPTDVLAGILVALLGSFLVYFVLYEPVVEFIFDK